MTLALRRHVIAEEAREERFATLYAAHAAVVRRVVHRLCDANDLDDLVQIAFLKIHESLDSLREHTSERAWVCQIALNTARDHLRRKKRAAWLRFLAPASLPEPEATPAGADDRIASEQMLRRALATLTPKLRDTVVLFSIEDLGIAEIATALAVPEGTVKSRLNQAREKLRAFFGQEGEDSDER